MANSDSSPNIALPFIQIRYINCTEKLSGFLVAFLGVLTSLWSNCVVVVGCTIGIYGFKQNQMFVEKNIIFTSQITHLLITISCTAGLYYGLKEKNRSLLTPWIAMKVIEIVVLLTGCILLATGDQEGLALMPVGIIFIVIGGYITLSVWYTYRQFQDTVTDADTVPHDEQLTSCPPSYDTYLHDAEKETQPIS